MNARHPSIRAIADFARNSAELCFSTTPSSLKMQSLTTVPQGCSSAVQSSCSQSPISAMALMPSHWKALPATVALRL